MTMSILSQVKFNVEVEPTVMLDHGEVEQNVNKTELTCSSTLQSTLPAPRPLRFVLSETLWQYPNQGNMFMPILSSLFSTTHYGAGQSSQQSLHCTPARFLQSSVVFICCITAPAAAVGCQQELLELWPSGAANCKTAPNTTDTKTVQCGRESEHTSNMQVTTENT